MLIGSVIACVKTVLESGMQAAQAMIDIDAAYWQAHNVLPLRRTLIDARRYR
ncbi:hypothetical protein [Luteibacter sp. UNCMF366Tsu5.1]|uniref:hypothetical protein n=1 Tax=Luteibacter sp. UNCMF366Tsu5.1 TaxID=1502758 RepID=UPI0009091776|nr:hypothetical protein [Luteibacter sp. UNCMF366Tsu5.1]SFW69805.1 hypothetical protein SAMN02800691_3049 [Luteibacter sp. UNCMF366Tsu5.1]